MYKVKKKDARGTSANCVVMLMDVALASFFVNFWTYFTPFSNVFIVNFEQVNTDQKQDSFTMNQH